MDDLDELLISLSVVIHKDDVVLQDCKDIIQELRLAREVVEAAKNYRISEEQGVFGERVVDQVKLDKLLTAYRQSIKANSPAGEMKEKG